MVDGVRRNILNNQSVLVKASFSLLKEHVKGIVDLAQSQCHDIQRPDSEGVWEHPRTPAVKQLMKSVLRAQTEISRK